MGCCRHHLSGCVDLEGVQSEQLSTPSVQTERPRRLNTQVRLGPAASLPLCTTDFVQLVSITVVITCPQATHLGTYEMWVLKLCDLTLECSACLRCLLVRVTSPPGQQLFCLEGPRSSKLTSHAGSEAACSCCKHISVHLTFSLYPFDQLVRPADPRRHN